MPSSAKGGVQMISARLHFTEDKFPVWTDWYQMTMPGHLKENALLAVQPRRKKRYLMGQASIRLTMALPGVRA